MFQYFQILVILLPLLEHFSFVIGFAQEESKQLKLAGKASRGICWEKLAWKASSVELAKRKASS